MTNPLHRQRVYPGVAVRWRAHKPPRWLIVVALVFGALLVVEGVRWVSFYRDVSAAQSSLQALERRLDLSSLAVSREGALEMRAQLIDARSSLDSAAEHAADDPLMKVARHLPLLDTQATAVADILAAARSSVDTGLAATDVLLAYAERQHEPGRTAAQEGVAFLESQTVAMTAVREHLEETSKRREEIPSGLIGPLDTATHKLDQALERLDNLVTGYERATALLPEMLGFHGPRTYLILAQNNTELFPSGGLISNYGTVTFEDGSVTDMQFEYFFDLYRRWQQETRGEYIEPPAALKQYLLHDVTWALGEAGWYPDFPTTAALATSFVEKGGVPPADGTIAIDLQFVAELLRFLGPITVGDYGVTVDAANLYEVTLAQTREQSALPDAVGKEFLSALAGDLVQRLFSTPGDRWPQLIELLGHAGEERHLQLHFQDAALQALSAEYGFAGAIEQPAGDFLMLTDTSVNSTKLNLILRNTLHIDVSIGEDGVANSSVTYTIENPFPEWQRGRDPQLVRALMLEGRYGAYLRLYAPPQARILDVRVDGRPAGAQAIAEEFEKRVFSRFTTVPPGETRRVQFIHESAGVITPLEDGWRRYRLYIQKQPGTTAIPTTIELRLPDGSTLREVTLDGAPASTSITTDLRVDRVIEADYRPPE